MPAGAPELEAIEAPVERTEGGDERPERADGERGRRRRRRRGRGRRPFETDGGENLDFVASEPPETPPAIAETDDEYSEPYLEPTPEMPPSVTPEPEPFVMAPAYSPASIDSGGAAVDVANAPEPEPYEPDLERREKFFARLSRWGKK